MFDWWGLYLLYLLYPFIQCRRNKRGWDRVSKPLTFQQGSSRIAAKTSEVKQEVKLRMFFISSSVQLFTCKMPPVLWVKRSVVPQGRRSSFHEFVGRFWSDWFHPGNPCRTERNFRLFVDPSVQKVLKQRNVIRFPLESTKGLRAYILRLRELSNFWPPPLLPCSIIRSQYLKLSSKENEGSLKGWFHSPKLLLVLRNTTNPKK